MVKQIIASQPCLLGSKGLASARQTAWCWQRLAEAAAALPRVASPWRRLPLSSAPTGLQALELVMDIDRRGYGLALLAASVLRPKINRGTDQPARFQVRGLWLFCDGTSSCVSNVTLAILDNILGSVCTLKRYRRRVTERKGESQIRERGRRRGKQSEEANASSASVSSSATTRWTQVPSKSITIHHPPPPLAPLAAHQMAQGPSNMGGLR